MHTMDSKRASLVCELSSKSVLQFVNKTPHEEILGVMGP